LQQKVHIYILTYLVTH